MLYGNEITIYCDISQNLYICFLSTQLHLFSESLPLHFSHLFSCSLIHSGSHQPLHAFPYNVTKQWELPFYCYLLIFLILTFMTPNVVRIFLFDMIRHTYWELKTHAEIMTNNGIVLSPMQHLPMLLDTPRQINFGKQ